MCGDTVSKYGVGNNKRESSLNLEGLQVVMNDDIIVIADFRHNSLKLHDHVHRQKYLAEDK